VAEQLRRRVIHGNAARTFQKQGSISGSGDNPESILQKLSEAASTLQLQQEQLKKEEAQVCQLGMLRAASASAEQSTASSMASVRKGRVRRASACSPIGVAVVYKQWHPAVSVLFADISSYTAMSQQVEPEQVGRNGEEYWVQQCCLRCAGVHREAANTCMSMKHLHALQYSSTGT
jgi:hypothetical protein